MSRYKKENVVQSICALGYIDEDSDEARALYDKTVIELLNMKIELRKNPPPDPSSIYRTFMQAAGSRFA